MMANPATARFATAPITELISKYEDDEYIDYGELNRRLKDILYRMDAGTFVPSVKISSGEESGMTENGSVIQRLGIGSIPTSLALLMKT